MARKDSSKVPPPIKLSKKNQMSEGFHGTTTSSSKLGVGDTLVPSNERHGQKRTGAALGDHTYFATTEQRAWDFNNRMREQESEDRKGDYKAPPRTRVFKTVPSQDQGLDRNYLRDTLEGIKMRQGLGLSPTGVRAMINEAKKTNHRVAGRQTIVSEEFGPPAPEGGRTDIALVGNHPDGKDFNWHEYGQPNWTVHTNTGSSWNSLGSTQFSFVDTESADNSQAHNDWVRGVKTWDKTNKTWKSNSRPTPLPGDEQLDLGTEWTREPNEFTRA